MHPSTWTVEPTLTFRDRDDAGARLAARLRHYRGRDDVIVLALPRGGVPVAHEVAKQLDAPLDVFLVRKLGLPGFEEAAMGAIAAGGVLVLDRGTVRDLGISEAVVQQVIARETEELARRDRAYRGDRAPPQVGGRVAILVDDGLATGATMLAAVAALRRLRPARVVVAAPVGSRSACRALEAVADEVVCIHTPEPFHAVGAWYDVFSQTTDEEVRDLLSRTRREPPPTADAR
jgi:predicted phosphoribosyltransferase